MENPFVVVTGLPGGGKTTVALVLAQAFVLPMLYKDDILERLFESKGVGDADWRRALSREADQILQTEAAASDGAVLVSHWHLPGMPSDSGTPTDWIGRLSKRVVNVYCKCPVELAAERYFQRKRHPGHLDHEKSYEEILASIQRVASYGPLDIGSCVEVESSQAPEFVALIDKVREVYSGFR